jgi:hypothetical protein
LRDICYAKPHELESQLGNPSRCEAVFDNFLEPMLSDHTDRVALKVMLKLMLHN